MNNIETYIKESNAIEGIHDPDAIHTSLDAWNYLTQHDTLTHDIVKNTHRHILKNQQPRIAGKYRDIQVYIANDTPPPPHKVHDKMNTLLKWTPKTPDEALQWHIQFEKIHPFQDGNGRTGRIIYWHHCHQLNKTPKLFTAQNRQKYYQLFR